MRWGKSDKAGTERIIRKFAYFPCKMADGIWLWLEPYDQYQWRLRHGSIWWNGRYEAKGGFMPGNGRYPL
jgi:hypothetical protein